MFLFTSTSARRLENAIFHPASANYDAKPRTLWRALSRSRGIKDTNGNNKWQIPSPALAREARSPPGSLRLLQLASSLHGEYFRWPPRCWLRGCTVPRRNRLARGSGEHGGRLDGERRTQETHQEQRPGCHQPSVQHLGPKTHPGRAQADAGRLGFAAIASSWLQVRLGKNSA